MADRFRRSEQRWLLTEKDAASLEAYLYGASEGSDRYGVETVYLRVTKRCRIRLRRYLVVGDQETQGQGNDQEATSVASAYGLDSEAKSHIYGHLFPNSLRGLGLAHNLRSAGDFQRLDVSRLVRGASTAGSRRRGKGKSTEAGTESPRREEQVVFQESLVHGA